MILKSPSGFFRTVLPPSIGNTGNVTYTISSNELPRGELYFLKINKRISPPQLHSSANIGVPSISTLIAKQNNILNGREPRPMGSVIEFTDQYKTMQISNQDLNEEFTFTKFSNNSTVDSELFEAYKSYQSKLLETSQQISSIKVKIDNDEISINVNVAKLQAINEALEILPDNTSLVNERQFVISIIEELELEIFKNKTIIIELDGLKSKYTDAVRKLSKVIQ